MGATKTKNKSKPDATSVKPNPNLPTGITAKQLALDLEIEPKSLRVWLRNHKVGVGRGKRYSFNKAQAAKIKKVYAQEQKARES